MLYINKLNIIVYNIRKKRILNDTYTKKFTISHCIEKN